MFSFLKKPLPSPSIYKKFHKLPHNKFIELIYRSIHNQKIKKATFPKFPDQATQINIIGSCNEASLNEPKNFYLQIHEVAKKEGLKFNKKTKILDFGCGYGRMYRFFMKDVPPGNLIGTDVTKKFYQLCIDSFSPKESVFMVNNPLPPLTFTNSTFDIIYLYSIFSHLSEEAFTAWLKEFYRIGKHGGLIIFTLRQQHFINDIQRMTPEQCNNNYTKTLYRQFNDPSIQQQYDAGNFIFFPNGGGEEMLPTFYGDTVIPPIYIYNLIDRYSHFFELVSSFDDPHILPQAFIALKIKKVSPNSLLT